MSMKTTIIILAAAVVLPAACDVKDPIYETAHPHHGQLTVTADWSAMGAGIAKPAGYTLEMGGHREQATADEHTVKELFAPDDYRLYAWNTAENITVSGTEATADYTAGTAGWFFSCAMDVAIAANRVHSVTAAMQQQVRQLTLVIAPAGGTADKIESITGTLSGVAATLDMDNGAHGSPSAVALNFTKGADGKWTATVRLLGVAGAGQKLSGTMTFTDGMPENIPLDSDLPDELAGFNSNKKEPFTLEGVVTETPTPTGFTATITEWKVVNRGSVIAD